MPDPESLKESFDRFIANEDRIHTFANGDDTQTYSTEGGAVVPSLQKFLAESTATFALDTSIATDAATSAAFSATAAYAAPLGILNSTMRDFFGNAVLGTVNGGVADTAYDVIISTLNATSGFWNGNFYPNDVTLADGAGNVHNWRLVYAA